MDQYQKLKPHYFTNGPYEYFKGKVQNGRKQGKGLVKIRTPPYEYLEEFQDDEKVREDESKYFKNKVPFKLCDHKSSKVSCLHIHKDWIISGSFQELIIQDKNTKKILFQTQTDMVNTVAFYHHKNLMVTTHNTAKYRVWDMDKFQEIKCDKLFQQRDIWSTIITEDDQYIIFSNNFDDCYCIDGSTYETISKSKQHYLSYYQGTLVGAFCEHITIVEIPSLIKIKSFATSHGVYTVVNNKNENIIAGVYENGIQIFNFDGAKIKQIPSTTIHFWSMGIFNDWIYYCPTWGQIDLNIIQLINIKNEKRIDIKNDTRVWKVILKDGFLISGDEGGIVNYWEWDHNENLLNFNQSRLGIFKDLHLNYK